jgi:plastocyanin
MRKLIALIIIIVIVVIAAVALTHKTNTPNPYNSSTGTQSNTGTQNKTSSNQNNVNQPSAVGSIDIKNMAFTPSQITISKGGTVTWTNNDTTAHTVTDDLSNVGGPASGTIEPGQTYSFTFNKTGSFQYHCSIHPSMRGTIVVK